MDKKIKKKKSSHAFSAFQAWIHFVERFIHFQ